jgi:hypothetical protein
MEGNWLAGWALVSGKHLHVIEALVAADDEVSDCSTSNVIHLLDARLVKDRSPFLSSVDCEATKQDSTVLT